MSEQYRPPSDSFEATCIRLRWAFGRFVVTARRERLVRDLFHVWAGVALAVVVLTLFGCTDPTSPEPVHPIDVTATLWDAADVPCTVRLDVTGGPATIEAWGYYGAAQGFGLTPAEVEQAFGSAEVGPAGLFTLVVMPGAKGQVGFWVRAAGQRQVYDFVEC